MTLYVLEGLEPPENVYLYDKTEHPQLRNECKLIFLISLNHNNRKTLWKVVTKQFREKLGYQRGDRRLTKKYIENHLNALAAHNLPISKYFNTGVAMKLMRKDSEIADRVLVWFVDQEIPIRCIHDSFIVPEQYQSLLKQAMIHFFQEVMDTDYLIGISTERDESEQHAYDKGNEDFIDEIYGMICSPLHSFNMDFGNHLLYPI